jgi:hypothetical protein
MAAEASVSPTMFRAGTGPAADTGQRRGVQRPPTCQRPDECRGPVQATSSSDYCEGERIRPTLASGGHVLKHGED